MTDAGAAEHEVKLGVPPGFTLPDLTRVAPGVTATPPAERVLVADYYDTDDLRLTRAGLSLRHRTPDGWTVKVPVGAADGDRSGGLVRREVPVDGPPGDVPAAAAALVEGVVAGRPLAPVVRLETRRTTVELRNADGTPLVEIADDDVAVSDPAGPSDGFREVEAEVIGPSGEDLLAAVVARLRDAGAGEPDPTPKVARAIRLVRPVVAAAGGVVWRPGEGGAPEVLVVHRPKYDDWSLPKGKRDDGETDEACALREVEEETGFRCTLGPELPTTRYFDNRGRPKVVRYWAMTVDSGEFTPGEEVDEIRWLPADAAAGVISYDHDRAVVVALAAG